MFVTDRQTLCDLQIFGESADAGSVYALFASGLTPGGRAKLEQMLLVPLDDCIALRKRRDTVRYFMEQDCALPVKLEDLKFVDGYLRMEACVGGFSVWRWGLRRFRSCFLPDNRLYVCMRGARLLKAVVQDCYRWTCENGGAVAGEVGVYRERMKELICRTGLVQALPEKRVSDMACRRLDDCFRRLEVVKVRELLDMLYELEVLMHVAKVAKARGLHLPEYVEKKRCLEMKGLYHPLLVHPVANDCCLSPDKPLCFLTGPNMAGKSTYMKAVGIAVYLAHVGFPVPAASMRISVFRGMFTTINLADNLEAGYSHYYGEVRRIKYVAERIRELQDVVVIFDELFRGTNVKDACDASLAVIGALARLPVGIFVISTHLLEVASRLADGGNIDFRCFGIGKKGSGLQYTYLLREGISDERLGMEILNREGVVETILAAGGVCFKEKC